jgi:Ca-activated chloride channel family protein
MKPQRFFPALLICVFIVTSAYADGLLLPQNPDYPKDFLRNRMTRVKVAIHGAVAETRVYQEFTNEWSKATDAVYSFPLPADARASQFLYWYNDTAYVAVLKVREQAVNPGTGEGGVAALVNEYIGRNGIKIFLKNIAPGKIQKVELFYIQRCNYYKGRYEYTFPFETTEFVTYPLEHFEYNIAVSTSGNITGYDVPSHPGFKVKTSTATHLELSSNLPKTYPEKDLQFWYQIDNSSLGVDFYSTANDSVDGHFALFLNPPTTVTPESVLPRRIFFLLGNSSRMYGYKLSQSIEALMAALDMLNTADYFNIILFNYNISKLATAPLPATAENITLAKNFLAGVSSQSGSEMASAIKTAFSQIADDLYSNAIIIISDGYSAVDPRQLETLNVHKAGIFPIAIGDDVARARLEMTAALNYGFVSYFGAEDNVKAGILRVIQQVSQPILRDVKFEFGKADLYDILPGKIPATYAGSDFFMAGRYANSGPSALAVAGKTVTGSTAYDFRLDFAEKKNAEYRFAEILWAKEMIDALEREIEIYGETPELKRRSIDLSLQYNIRCRYTAYIADYETVAPGDYTSVVASNDHIAEVPRSYLLGNYPNPFNPVTVIAFYIGPQAAKEKTKLIRIFNCLGQLVAVIDISHLGEGFHQVTFNGVDYFGQSLPSGVYYVHLQAGDEISTIRITLLK